MLVLFTCCGASRSRCDAFIFFFSFFNKFLIWANINHIGKIKKTSTSQKTSKTH